MPFADEEEETDISQRLIYYSTHTYIPTYYLCVFDSYLSNVQRNHVPCILRKRKVTRLSTLERGFNAIDL